MNTKAISQLVDFMATMPMCGEAQIIQLGGAITDVPENGSAFANRDAPWWLSLALHWDDPARDHAHIAQIRELAEKLTPHAASGAYVNALNANDTDRVVDAYGGPERYTRLGQIKARYDPDNLFRVNHNIHPVHG